jgi:hypothetical protein
MTMTKEYAPSTEVTTTYPGIINALDYLAPTTDHYHIHAADGSRVERVWNNHTARKLRLTPALAERLGMGDTVRCSITGRDEVGVTLTMRSRRLFDTNKKSYAFRIIPVKNTPDYPNGFVIMEGPTIPPYDGNNPTRGHILNEQLAVKATVKTADELVRSLLLNVDTTNLRTPEPSL